MTWRAGNTFTAALLWAFLCCLSAILAAAALAINGPLSDLETRRLLGYLYWGLYPASFVALVALTWHFVRFYRGDYARH